MEQLSSKICIINCYFGELPPIFELWMESCKFNKTIDFLLVTDQNIKPNIKNLKVINMNLNTFVELVDKKLCIRSNIKKPHKICDFKPLYGIIFQDYISEYRFWGHCDLDMIFGDLRKFITEDILAINDKIYPLGHLSLYRNEYMVNNRVFEKNSKLSFNNILNDNRTLGFDEINGIYNIYKENNYPMYTEFEFADITHRFKRFKLSCAYKNLINYKYQIFYWEEGKVYRAYLYNNDIKKEEFSYIHFQKRNLKIINTEMNNMKYFLITNLGLIKLGTNINITKDIIIKYNNNKGKLYEFYESKIFDIKNILKAIRDKMVSK
ncbi:hypothetical protein QTH73_09760 [Clostridium perfringens]|nr:hypothetical protein [Clostridium perfringens]